MALYTVVVPKNYQLNMVTDGSTSGTYTVAVSSNGFTPPDTILPINSDITTPIATTNVTYLVNILVGVGFVATILNPYPVNVAGLPLVDNTIGNVDTTKHGFCPKLSGVSTEYLSGTGVYSTPAGGGSGSGVDYFSYTYYGGF